MREPGPASLQYGAPASWWAPAWAVRADGVGEARLVSGGQGGRGRSLGVLWLQGARGGVQCAAAGHRLCLQGGLGVVQPPPPVLHITGDLTQQEGRSPDVIPGPGQLLPRSRLALSGRRGALNTATKGVFMNR